MEDAGDEETGSEDDYFVLYMAKYSKCSTSLDECFDIDESD